MKAILVAVLLIVIAGLAVKITMLHRGDAPSPVIVQRSLNSNDPTAQPDAVYHSVDSPAGLPRDLAPVAPPIAAVLPLQALVPEKHPALPIGARNSDPTVSSTKPKASIAPVDQGPQPIIPEAEARVALDNVGIDPVSDMIWLTAINDPNLDEKSRKDLIEDLNENGLSNPDHPSMNDLPLIENRLDMIEDLAPDSMDDINFAAFAEAYKDLSAMEKSLNP